MVYLSQARNEQKRKRNRIMMGVGCFAVLIALIVALISIGSGEDKDVSPVATSTQPSTPAPVPSPANADECVKVELDPNVNFNVVSKVTDVGYAINNRNEDLAAMKKDPRNLAFRAWQMTLWSDHSQWQPLVSGNCLSKQGIDLYNRVFNVLMGRDSNIKLTALDENAQAPAHYTNSGFADGVPVINETSGIDGDRAAIKYSIQLTGGSSPMDLYVLKRCGNPTFESRPPLPTRRIDTPPTRGTGTGTPPPRTTRYTPPPPPPPPPPCEGPGCCEDCPPPPEEVCPPWAPHGNPETGCKDGVENGPGQVVDEEQRPNPLPALPELEEPDAPDVPYPTEEYTPPDTSTVVVVPEEEGGPTAIPTPRETPAPEAEAPTPDAPETACIPAPGMDSC